MTADVIYNMMTFSTSAADGSAAVSDIAHTFESHEGDADPCARRSPHDHDIDAWTVTNRGIMPRFAVVASTDSSSGDAPSSGNLASRQYSQGPGTQRKTSPSTAT